MFHQREPAARLLAPRHETDADRTQVHHLALIRPQNPRALVRVEADPHLRRSSLHRETPLFPFPDLARSCGSAPATLLSASWIISAGMVSWIVPSFVTARQSVACPKSSPHEPHSVVVTRVAGRTVSSGWPSMIMLFDSARRSGLSSVSFTRNRTRRELNEVFSFRTTARRLAPVSWHRSQVRPFRSRCFHSTV